MAIDVASLQNGKCIDEDVLVSFLKVKLAASESSAVEAHLDNCPRCHAVLIHYAKSETRSSNDPNGLNGSWPNVLYRRDAVRRYVVLENASALKAIYRRCAGRAFAMALRILR